MFNKDKCKRCGSKVSKKDNFCPNCGFNLNSSNKDDFGLLGKNDFFEEEIKLPVGFNVLFKSLMKNLDKELSNLSNGLDKKDSSQRRGINITFSSSFGQAPKIRINTLENSNKKNIQQSEEKKLEKKEIISKPFSNKKAKEFSKLIKKEPLTEIRRLSDSIIYELKLPGVKSINDISINRLEDSIEVRAISKTKGYFKVIPIGLPIKDYSLKKGVLSLKLKE